LDFSRAPGTDRFFLAERFGKIFSFANDPQTDKADLFIDLKKTVYAIAAHPQFAQNGYLFVTYVLDPKETLPKGTRVSRFTARKDKPWEADPASEKIIIEWPCGGHN